MIFNGESSAILSSLPQSRATTPFLSRCALPALCDNIQREYAPVSRRVEVEAMGDLLQPTHLLILVIVLLVLFGGKKLPELGKGLGEGLRGFKEGLKGVDEPAAPVPPAAAQQNTVPAPPPATPVQPQITRR
jgi:sec-independent protein translocase protein TatA